MVTKIDLAMAVEFNAAEANHNIQAVRPGMVVLNVSAKSGEDMDGLLELLGSRRATARVVAASQNASAFAAHDE